MTTPVDRDDEELLARLQGLPVPAPDELTAARVRRHALAALARERALDGRPALRAVERFFSVVVEPALVAGTVGVYLVWAVRAVEALYR